MHNPDIAGHWYARFIDEGKDAAELVRAAARLNSGHLLKPFHSWDLNGAVLIARNWPG
jgi:hypothetical protein